jgi:hypothetical protein
VTHQLGGLPLRRVGLSQANIRLPVTKTYDPLRRAISFCAASHTLPPLRLWEPLSSLCVWHDPDQRAILASLMLALAHALDPDAQAAGQLRQREPPRGRFETLTLLDWQAVWGVER